MRKYLYIASIIIVAVASCKGKVDDNNIQINQEGFISGQNVRVRGKPDLNASVLGFYKIGTMVNVSFRTSQKVTVNNMNEYWYKTEDGWIYGKYIDFGGSFNLQKQLKTIAHKNNNSENYKLLIGDVHWPVPMEVSPEGETVFPEIGYTFKENYFIFHEWGAQFIYGIVETKDEEDVCTVKGELVYQYVSDERRLVKDITHIETLKISFEKKKKIFIIANSEYGINFNYSYKK